METIITKMNKMTNDYTETLNYSNRGTSQITTEIMEDQEMPTTFTDNPYIGAKANPSSILVSLDDGKIIGHQGSIDKMRETGSTIKIIVGYFGLKLLGPNHNVHIYDWVLNNCEGDVSHFPGEIVTMEEAFASGFPMSDNILAYSIAVELGINANGGIVPTTDAEFEAAYNRGLLIMNQELERMGYHNIHITDAAGFNTGDHFSYQNFGYSNDNAGASTMEMAEFMTVAFNDHDFAKAFSNQNAEFQAQAFNAHSEVITTCEACGVNTNPEEFFSSNPNEGVYFIKSGTQGYKSCVMGIVTSSGERYVYVANGIGTDGNYIMAALYDIDQAFGTNYSSS